MHVEASEARGAVACSRCYCSLPLTTSSSSKGGRRGRQQQGLELAAPRLRVRLRGLLLRHPLAWKATGVQGGKGHRSMRGRLGAH